MIYWTLLDFDDAREIWSEIEHEIEQGLAKGPGNANEIHGMVRAHRVRIMIAQDDIGIRKGSLVFSKKDDIGFIISIAGRDISNQQSVNGIHSILREYGCNKTQGLCAPGAERLWSRVGYKPIQTLMEIDLWADL